MSSFTDRLRAQNQHEADVARRLRQANRVANRESQNRIRNEKWKARYDKKFGLMDQQEREQLQGAFGGLRQGLQGNIAGRGMSRSGFSSDLYNKLGSAESSAMADLQAGQGARFSDWRRNFFLAAAARRKRKGEAKDSRRQKAIGAGLAAAGLLLAIPTGGASMSLTGAGAQMYGSA